MKYLFLGIALLLAIAATAQPQTKSMHMADPDLKQQAEPAPADNSGAVERNPAAEYLLYLVALEACCPEQYMEEINALYKAETPLAAERLAYLIKTRRSGSQYLAKN